MKACFVYRWYLLFAALLAACLSCIRESQPTFTPSPAERDERADSIPRTPVHWIDVTNDDQFLQTIFQHPRVVVFFGTVWCAPCFEAEQWWEAHPAPLGWTFIRWTARDQQEVDGPFSLELGSFARQAKERYAMPWAMTTLTTKSFTLPVAVTIVNASKGMLITDMAKASFVGRWKCQEDLLNWLERNTPAGAK